MNKHDLYLLYAADCQQMAYITRNEHERLTWLDMAQSWLQLAEVHSTQSQFSSLSPIAMRRSAAIPVGHFWQALRFGAMRS